MDVDTKVCLRDFQEIVVSSCKNMYLVCDPAWHYGDLIDSQRLHTQLI
jgi:hypothetical protein